MLAVLECLHDLGFFGGLQAPVNQADGQLGQLLAQALPGDFGGLGLELFGLFDQRAHPVRLAALGAAGTDPLDDLLAAAVGDQHGIDRCASGGQLVQDRGVQIRIGAHGQGAREWG